jgi:uncharacterized protein YjbI with pentapeptide repeats
MVRSPPPGSSAAPIQADTQTAVAILARRRGVERERLRIDFYNLALVNLDISRGQLPNLNAYYSNFEAGRLVDSNLRAAGFGWANLRNSFLSRSKLRGADFSWADLRGSFLTGVDAQAASFRGARLEYADFSGRKNDDGSMSVRPANLRRADFEGAHTMRTDFRGVDLRQVRGLTHEQIRDSQIDTHTRLPKGLTAGREW